MSDLEDSIIGKDAVKELFNPEGVKPVSTFLNETWDRAEKNIVSEIGKSWQLDPKRFRSQFMQEGNPGPGDFVRKIIPGMNALLPSLASSREAELKAQELSDRVQERFTTNRKDFLRALDNVHKNYRRSGLYFDPEKKEVRVNSYLDLLKTIFKAKSIGKNPESLQIPQITEDELKTTQDDILNFRNDLFRLDRGLIKLPPKKILEETENLIKDETSAGVYTANKQIEEINKVLAGLPANYAVNINPAGDVELDKLRLASLAARYGWDKTPTWAKYTAGVGLPVSVGLLAWLLKKRKEEKNLKKNRKDR
jgi:hypothetical protein